MKVLILGGGGREHALAWKLSRSPEVAELVVAPGNAGFDPAWERFGIDLSKGKPEFERLANFCKSHDVDFVMVGPDNPLADGVVDVLLVAGIPAFGPTASAARIEASKSFAKDVMKSAGVPTAEYRVFDSVEESKKFLKSAPWSAHGWVIKADGLAFGKGVIVCKGLGEALKAVDELFKVSGKLVIEEELTGDELSWMAFCDGENFSLLEPARDYKRLKDLNQGPNTGGMGAFSPVPGIPEAWYERMGREVFAPTLREMKKRGCPFKGLLYAGLMVDPKRDRFWVIEFNSRFGDPETQVLLPRIEGDLMPWLLASVEGVLGAMPRRVPFVSSRAVCVVAAAPGYPDKPQKGLSIVGAEAEASRESLPDYFFAGVTGAGDALEVSGGRVLTANGMGETLEQARKNAYHRLEQVAFEGMQFRRDIGEGLQ